MSVAHERDNRAKQGGGLNALPCASYLDIRRYFASPVDLGLLASTNHSLPWNPTLEDWTDMNENADIGV